LFNEGAITGSVRRIQRQVEGEETDQTDFVDADEGKTTRELQRPSKEEEDEEIQEGEEGNQSKEDSDGEEYNDDGIELSMDKDEEDDSARPQRIVEEERNQDPLISNLRKVRTLFEEEMLQPDHYKSLLELLQHILLDSCYDDYFSPVKKLPDSGSTDPVTTGNLVLRSDARSN
jgi:hypothetical protein